MTFRDEEGGRGHLDRALTLASISWLHFHSFNKHLLREPRSELGTGWMWL
jgi:hypothetical protein